MTYQAKDIERKWQKYWQEHQTFAVSIDKSKPKYYVLDMFPYPSGAGLHVGHPLGYIASDIITRYKRLKGFNVLHPMGYDAFGLPAEQYAIQTGQHPAKTTEQNIKRYREQLDRIGLSFDWQREVRTCDADYYKWTQWAFIRMYEHWYDTKANKARPIAELEKTFISSGNAVVEASHGCTEVFDAAQWKAFDAHKKEFILQCYRLAFRCEANVNWCPALGTVLANDEVKDGYSVRGNHPVEQRKMQQWSLRISAYADRLLKGLETIDWPESLKEVQRNWIGRSEGAEVEFAIKNQAEPLKIFTTRPDTIFGVSAMVLAPESSLVVGLTTSAQKSIVEIYLAAAKLRTERDRIADAKQATGVFTGSFCIHPFTKKEIPIWISDYVLGGYGTGAIMAVPAHDQRDYVFAKTFDLPIVQVIEGGDISERAYEAKSGKVINSDFLNGLDVPAAIDKALKEFEKSGKGVRKVNYRLRDAIFSRQRYWGEPIPMSYKDGIPQPLKDSELPLKLPDIDAYLPTESGEPPLGRSEEWRQRNLELTTMPGFAGSSAYYLRYMDPKNDKELVSRKANQYWGNVDFYVGGNEHATGHLIYSRYWNMFLHDMGLVKDPEPFQKLVNQGMIQGRSNFVYRETGKNHFISHGLKDKFKTSEIHVDVNLVKNDILDVEAFKKWRPEFASATFSLEEGVYRCGSAVEKMSKSLFNVVNPDDIIEQYGADTLRLYEMFLGPIEQSKPWNTNGIEGVFRFLGKLWRLFYDDADQLIVEDTKASADELRVLHTLIKKITEDMASFSLNTSVSAFMICVNELSKLNCHKKEILEKLIIALTPFAPHISEELWESLGHKPSVHDQKFPDFNDAYLIQSNFSYPVSVNGKMKFLLDLPAGLTVPEIEKIVATEEKCQALLAGKQLKKMIIVPNKIINLVVS